MSLKITGTGRALPKRCITNNELTSFIDTSDEWISSRTGIHSRYICSEESMTDLCVTAAENALDRAGLKSSDMDRILCSTISGDYVTPSLACTVAERLGATCPAFDINAACTGFLYTLDVADSLLSSGKANHILIICCEMMSKHADWNDRSSCVLFGDGAGACVASKGNALQYCHLMAAGNPSILHIRSGLGNCPFRENTEPEFLHMEGQEVFKFAVSTIESLITAALQELTLQPEDIDYYLLHQANKRIIDSARTRLKQPREKFPTNIERCGNISSASIPILLDEMVRDGQIKKGDRLLMSAFGAGLTAGICVMNWE